MSLLNANLARFFFEVSELAPEVFDVARFTGVEKISQPYRFEVDLFSDDPFIDFGKVVGQRATFTMMRGDKPVPIHGVVADFQQRGRTKDHVAYRAVLVPGLWQLALNQNSRVFQRMSVGDIINKVLGDHEVTFQTNTIASYEPREYCVQFQESDLNFISRLMEHEGMWYSFDHEMESGKETLLIFDSNISVMPIKAPSALDYHEGEGMIPGDVEAIQNLVYREQVFGGFTVNAKEYNYETPNAALLQAKANPSIDVPFGMSAGDYYEHNGHYKDDAQGKRLVTVRSEEFIGQGRVLHGGSNCVGFSSGYKFTLKKHYRSDLNEDYLLVEIRHEGSQRHAMGFDVTEEERSESGVLYHNTFECRPAKIEYRPPRITPVPKVPGLLTAFVDHPSRGAEDRTLVDDYAHLDDQGRYKARMDFDFWSEAGATDFTLPVRMCQPYSGPDFGIHFPNQGGTEMVIACVNGDIDRPMALGTVPNPNQVSPSTSANKWQNVIRTWGKNELTFDDKVGEENIYMHATKDHTVEVVNDETITVGNDQSIDIGHDRTKHVGHDQSEAVDNNKSITVGVDHTESIGSNKSLTVGSNHSESIGANMTINVGANLTEMVAINYSESVGASMQLNVGVNLSEVIGANASQTVGSNKTVQIGSNLSETTGKDKTVTVGKNVKEKVGGDHHEEVGKEYVVNAKKIQLLAEDQIVLKTGKAEIIMKKNGDIEIQGKKIQIKGSGDLILKGKKIKEN